MEIKTRERAEILSDEPLKITIAGNVIDVMQTARRSYPPQIEWSDDRESYIILATGEVRQKKKRETRTDDDEAVASLKRSMRKMRQLVNANFDGDRNELFITLTYAENMRDPKKLRKDMEKFLKKAKRRLGEIKYLYVVEPQARGAWHSHCLVKQLSAHSTYWPAEDIADAWGHGFIKVQRLTDCDNVGAYLSAYMSNAPADAEDDVQRDGQRNYGELGEDVPKNIIKGERAKLYPRGMHIYRGSQNLSEPITKKIRPTSKEYQALIAGAELRYARTIDLYDADRGDDATGYINSITQMQFVRKLDEPAPAEGAEEK